MKSGSVGGRERSSRYRSVHGAKLLPPAAIVPASRRIGSAARTMAPGCWVHPPRRRHSPGSITPLLLASPHVARAESQSIDAEAPLSWKSSIVGAEPHPTTPPDRTTRPSGSGTGVALVRAHGADHRSAPVAAS